MKQISKPELDAKLGEFRATPKKSDPPKEDLHLLPELDIRRELENIKASLAKTEKQLEDILHHISRPHRQW